MSDHVYESDDDQPSVPACPVCGRVTPVLHNGKGLAQWWCGDCNTAFPDDELGPVSSRWATKARRLIAEGRRDRKAS